ncbi:Uncharacterized protein ALO68_02285 [Pseudomonas syringae pv. helianthi]|uniref:Uncharacterized protein n=1 Tax=Pseudomonas syringae pv. helianthi TaxID=251654 RepID=A0A0N8RNE4_9PSED|nr:hypothetical protein [Pseudomonas syringae group genomosp. 7]KPX45359.1 Uncharacterized protein ALO68_02285 [Pseudomonas syringae pv. helianthi]UNB63045.1 hypothetical protein MME54_26325 [Pseudomonas syringae pv. helianthi]
MSKEDRIYFEEKLQEELQNIECKELAVKAVKKGLKFRFEKKIVAELDFQYLVKSHAFTLNGRVFGGPIFDCMSKIDMPYKSNLGSDACFSFTTSGRQDKKFSPSIYGTIAIPRPEHASETCNHIKHALEEYYIPLIVGCVLPSERTIDDVLYSPRDYSYPAAFIHCAVKCNSSKLKNKSLAELRNNKNIIKNKDFDLDLLDTCFS